MLNVEKWAQDKNPVIAFFAINHAMTAREKCDALRHVKERGVYDYKFLLPDLPSWCSMYQSRKPLFAYKRLMSHYPEETEEKIALLAAFRWLNKAMEKFPERIRKLKLTAQDIQDALKFWQDLCSDTYAEIKADIAKKPLDFEARDKFHAALIKDELTLGFYFLVYMPCLLFYGVTPTVLYRNALNRDISAIEKLLKLDSLILHDPAIGFQIQSIRLYGKANDYARILDAITKQPKINRKMIADERKSVKSDHGAQILVLSKALNNPLEVPQIRGLYDALAFDYDGSLIDTDIMKPAGFDKTIKTKAATYQKEYQKLEKQK